MKLPQRHKKILLEEKHQIESYETTQFLGGFCWMNSKFTDIILENISETHFESMYPTLMVIFHKEGLVNLPEFERISWFLENKQKLKETDKSEYDKHRYWVNSVYGKISMSRDPLLIRGLISKYERILYKDILEKNSDIIYIDTDTILSVNPVDLGDCPLLVSTQVLPFGIFEKEKRYVYHDGNQLKVRGWPLKNHKQIRLEVLGRLRQYKLEKMGIK